MKILKRRSLKKKQLLKKRNSGVIHINSTLNNTLLTLTDSRGNTLGWSSSGSVGIKNSRKSSSYSAQLAGEDLGKKCVEKGRAPASSAVGLADEGTPRGGS